MTHIQCFVFLSQLLHLPPFLSPFGEVSLLSTALFSSSTTSSSSSSSFIPECFVLFDYILLLLYNLYYKSYPSFFLSFFLSRRPVSLLLLWMKTNPEQVSARCPWCASRTMASSQLVMYITRPSQKLPYGSFFLSFFPFNNACIP